jgi:hypothetical protein
VSRKTLKVVLEHVYTYGVKGEIIFWKLRNDVSFLRS